MEAIVSDRDFAATVTQALHRVRTEINSVKTQLIDYSDKTEQAAHILATAKRDQEKVAELVDSLCEIHGIENDE